MVALRHSTLETPRTAEEAMALAWQFESVVADTKRGFWDDRRINLKRALREFAPDGDRRFIGPAIIHALNQYAVDHPGDVKAQTALGLAYATTYDESVILFGHEHMTMFDATETRYADAFFMKACAALLHANRIDHLDPLPLRLLTRLLIDYGKHAPTAEQKRSAYEQAEATFARVLGLNMGSADPHDLGVMAEIYKGLGDDETAALCQEWSEKKMRYSDADREKAAVVGKKLYNAFHRFRRDRIRVEPAAGPSREQGTNGLALN